MLAKIFFRTHTSFILVLSSLMLIAGFLLPGCENKDPLTPGERTWLKQHTGQITINNEKGWPPIIDTDINGYPIGIAVDYYRLLEQKLDFKFKLDKLDTWTNVVNKLQDNKIEVICEMQRNPERSKHVLFTKPYIEIPNVIIVRKEHKGSFALENMRDMKIAVSKGYAITNFIKTNYNYLDLVLFNEDTSCLHETATKNVDAAVMNLAVASFLIEKQGITNLRIAGYADYTNALCFASRKDWPILNRILEKGLALITQAEKDAIYQNWISLGLRYKPFYKNRQFLIVFGSIAGVAIAIIFAILIWNQSLKKQVKFRTENLKITNIQLKNEIAERNKAEKELRDSHQFNETILNASPDIIYIYDILKKVNIYSNEGIMRVLGYSITEIKNMGDRLIQILMHPDDFKIYLNETVPKYQSAKDNEFIEHEHRMKHKNGQWYWLVSKESIFLRHKDGNPKQIFGMTSDITNRKLAEEALKESEILLKETQKIAKMGGWEYNVQTNVATYTDMIFEIYGETFSDPEEGIKFYHIDDRMVVSQSFENAVAKNEPYDIEVRLRNAQGDNLWVRTVGKPVAEDGKVIKIIGNLIDITERKKLESQVQQAQKMESIGTLAGGIAHDFNNLLYVVMGNISLVKDDIGPEIEASETLRAAEAACIKAKELSAQLITFSKGGDPVKKMMPIDNLLKDTFISLLKELNLKSNISLADSIRQVNIDGDQIKQVIRHIIVNAKEAMDENGQLKVSCENIDIPQEGFLTLNQGKYIKISFEDQGCGISKENMGKIFDPYFSTKIMGIDKGQGLGLTISYSIIKKHGGLIDIKSELETGSTFSVYLPEAVSAKEPNFQESGKKSAIHKPVEQPVTGKRKILLMDDEETIRKLMDRVLNKLGYGVKTCTEGNEAVQIYKKAMESKEPFDTVVLDLTNKIGMGGQEAMRRLLEIDPNAKGIAITGYSSDPVVSNYRAYGFSGFLTKPATKDELDKVISDVVSKNR